MSKKAAVIGVGNTLRRDDGIGIVILESLLKFYKRNGLDYLDFNVASFDLLNRIRDYDRVLLIDGIDAGLAAGEVKIFSPEDISRNSDIRLGSTHEFNLKGMFALAKKLGVKARIYIAGIQIKDASFGEGLTAELKNKEKDIIKKIMAFIDKKLCVQ
ncbi:MAG: hydrogenase maturation protease [Candidatus Omnitrophica bacterium]|nr:hydrogenase maturation protease [Candidatus Omnitrophota bacterium]